MPPIKEPPADGQTGNDSRTRVSSHAVDGTRSRLAERLNRLRRERGFRLADVAAVSGISEAHLSRIESAERWPSLPTLLTLAAAFGVDASSLLMESGPRGTDTLHGAGATWHGEEDTGLGLMTNGGIEVGYDLESRLSASRERTGDDRLSSPEELVGMALAGCFSMSLARSLSVAGFPPNRITTEAEVTLRSGPEEVAIAGIHLRCAAEVNGVTRTRLDEIAHATKRSCVVSRALAAVAVTLDVELLPTDAHEHHNQDRQEEVQP